MFRIQGLGGSCSAVLFSRPYATHREFAHDDFVGLFRGRVDRTRDEPSLLVDDVLELDDSSLASGRKLLLDVQADGDEDLACRLAEVRLALAAHPGPTETYLSVTSGSQPREVWRLGKDDCVGVTAPLVSRLEELLGPELLHLR